MAPLLFALDLGEHRLHLRAVALHRLRRQQREQRVRDSRPLLQIGVFTALGSISDTPMPAGASSTRSASANARSANFDMLYGATNGTASRPEIEPTNTSRPRDERSCGRKACASSMRAEDVDLEDAAHFADGQKLQRPADGDAGVAHHAAQRVTARARPLRPRRGSRRGR